jgi:hypothetical protein
VKTLFFICEMFVFGTAFVAIGILLFLNKTKCIIMDKHYLGLAAVLSMIINCIIVLCIVTQFPWKL